MLCGNKLPDGIDIKANQSFRGLGQLLIAEVVNHYFSNSPATIFKDPSAATASDM